MAWKDRLESILQPFEFLNEALKLHIVAFKELFHQNGLKALTQVSQIRNLGVAKILRLAQEHWIRYEDTTAVPNILLSTTGTTLDIGPGTGNQLHRLPSSAITTIYGVEPNPHFASDLAVKLADHDLRDKYHVVTCGIEDSDVLEKYGIVEGSMDTVLCIQVLCSVHDPEAVMREVWRLLKPGGRFVFWEHGRNRDFWTAVVQACWNRPWSALVGGCCINRDVKNTVLSAGEWKNPEEIEQDGDRYTLLPRTWGVLIKKA